MSDSDGCAYVGLVNIGNWANIDTFLRLGVNQSGVISWRGVKAFFQTKASESQCDCFDDSAPFIYASSSDQSQDEDGYGFGERPSPSQTNKVLFDDGTRGPCDKRFAYLSAVTVMEFHVWIWLHHIHCCNDGWRWKQTSIKPNILKA